ncbi:MAG: hypothetical protein Q9184_006170 [Pyrenodesmia sp. 2 TL-2023]
MSLNSLTRTTKATEDVYGVEDLQPAVQEQGSVMIREALHRLSAKYTYIRTDPTALQNVGEFPISATKAAEMRDEMLQERAEL